MPRQSADWLAMTECVGDGVLDVPSARRCRAGNGSPRQSVPQGHLLRGADWLAMTRCVGADDSVRPCDDLTKTGKRLIIHLKDAAMNGRRLVTAPKGGDIHVLDAYIPYRRLLSLDQDTEAEKTKPPLPQVTVSIWC